MIDVDEVQADGFVTKSDLTRPRFADLDLLPLQDVRAAGLMNADGVWHARLTSSLKKSPAAAVAATGLCLIDGRRRLVSSTSGQRREQEQRDDVGNLDHRVHGRTGGVLVGIAD